MKKNLIQYSGVFPKKTYQLIRFFGISNQNTQSSGTLSYNMPKYKKEITRIHVWIYIKYLYRISGNLFSV